MPELTSLIFYIFLLFFMKFSSSGWVGTEFGTKIFYLYFSAYLLPFWLKIMPKRGFLVFWIFLLFFSGESCFLIFRIFLEFSFPGLVGTEFGTKIFFSFLTYLILVWIEIIRKWFVLIFWIFLLFFLEFFRLGRVGTEFETNFFFFFF